MGSLPFVLVTGNRNKQLEAERLIRSSSEGAANGAPRLDTVALDLPEIQGLDTEEILAAKVGEAWRLLGRPLVVEETSLAIDALGGFPGPLVKWMLDSTGAEGLAGCALGLASSLGEERWAGDGVEVSCWLAYRDATRSVVAVGSTRGRLVLPPRGEGGFGWDPVVEPEGLGETFGELSEARKDEVGHRGRAWRSLIGRLRDEGVI